VSSGWRRIAEVITTDSTAVIKAISGTAVGGPSGGQYKHSSERRCHEGRSACQRAHAEPPDRQDPNGEGCADGQALLNVRKVGRRQDERPGDLDQGQQAIQVVVVVVHGGEPGEVHPGPPDREEHPEVVAEGVGEVTLAQVVVQMGGGLGDGRDETEVEEQFQRRRSSQPCDATHAARFRPSSVVMRQSTSRASSSAQISVEVDGGQLPGQLPVRNRAPHSGSVWDPP